VCTLVPDQLHISTVPTKVSLQIDLSANVRVSPALLLSTLVRFPSPFQSLSDIRVIEELGIFAIFLFPRPGTKVFTRLSRIPFPIGNCPFPLRPFPELVLPVLQLGPRGLEGPASSPQHCFYPPIFCPLLVLGGEVSPVL